MIRQYEHAGLIIRNNCCVHVVHCKKKKSSQLLYLRVSFSLSFIIPMKDSCNPQSRQFHKKIQPS